MRRGGVALLLLALLASPGCLTSTQATRLQSDLDEVKRQLFAVQQDGAASRARVEEIDRKMGGGTQAAPGNQAELQALMRSLLDQIQALGEELRVTKGRLASLQQELQAARPSAPRSALPSQGAPAAATPGASGANHAADEAYKAAYADYTRGSYELASGGFEAFLKSWPEHSQAPDAQYWIGECLYSRQKFEEATAAFDTILTRWPGCDRTAAALLKKGMAQMESGHSAQGVATLQDLIARSPASDEARLAADRLRQMGLRGSR